MTHCDFMPMDQNKQMCSRCGFIVRDVPPERSVVRHCDALNLDGARKPRKQYLPLGNAVAKVATAMGIRGREGCGCDERREKLNHLVPNPLELLRSVAAATARPSLLLEFHHGFGDAVQLTTVLLHLKNHQPDWVIDLVCKAGSHTLYHSLVRNVFPLGRRSPNGRDYTARRWLRWPEVFESYPDSPATKAEFCLRRIFDIAPEESLCRYHVKYGPDEARRAHTYLATVTGQVPATKDEGGRRKDEAPDPSFIFHPSSFRRFPVVLLHYQGNTARSRKNIDEQIVRRVTQVVRARGYVPVVLDWNWPHRSKLIDYEKVFCPNVHDPLWQQLGTGDGATLAALIDMCALFVGVDSGPQKVAAATGTTTIGVWTKHHPVHFCGLADNVVHLVPPDHERYIRGNREVGLEYFTHKYQQRVCRKHLRYELPDLVDAMLGVSERC